MEKTIVQERLLKVYDYIIVGAGSCGCVLANRLSEDANKSVLVLEAGADDLQNPDIAVPGKCAVLQNTEYNWAYMSEPQQHSYKGCEEQRTRTPRGKGLGGSSAINYMIYMRGTPHDYDTWENMGCSGWSYRDVLPYFIKSEGCLVPRLVENGYHGTDGPMLISEARLSPMGDIYIQSCKELGYREADCNGKDPIGVMRIQNNIGDGVRQSSAECFLRPASDRPNLHIATLCHVRKIFIDNKIARGVEFVRNGEKQIIRARREVLLCAGAVGSPQLLMLSGIGPEEHLKSLAIPVLMDLPVGCNLQDHCFSWGMEFEMNKPFSVNAMKDMDSLYKNLRAGFSSTNAMEATCFIRSDLQDPGNPNPDLLLYFGTFRLGFSGESCVQTNNGITAEIWDAMFAGVVGKNGFTISPAITHPKSRGTIRLATTDPLTPPIIDPNTLSHPDDFKVLVEGFKTAMRISQTEVCKSIGAKFSGRVLPGYQGVPFTDEYWEEVARTLTVSPGHLCGTCRMGRLRESTTVVDPQLRVKGLERLRVVDASILPEITSANLNATCIMIAEKAADMIKRVI